MKISMLCSGTLGLNVLKKVRNKYNVSCIFTDKNSKEIIEYCLENDIKYFKNNPRDGKGIIFLKQFKIDVILSVNYLYIIEKEMINYPSIISINIHGSLLPKYRGRTPHVWAIINGERKTGITIHRISEGCDEGEIIKQKEIDIEHNDSGADIMNKFNKNYFPLIDTVLNEIKNEKYTLTPQNHQLATFFGKRSPEDGKIDWEWNKENIRNWVRAQRDPYPGAFTFLNNEKIIIDEVNCIEKLVNSSIPNGTIIETTPLIKVKVQDGVIEVKKHRINNITFNNEQIKFI